MTRCGIMMYHLLAYASKQSKAKHSRVEARHDMRAPSNKLGDETQSRVGADMQRWQWKQSKQWKQWK